MMKFKCPVCGEIFEGRIERCPFCNAKFRYPNQKVTPLPKIVTINQKPVKEEKVNEEVTANGTVIKIK